MAESLGLVKDGKKGKGDREGLWEIRVANTLSRRKGTSKDTGRYWSILGDTGQRPRERESQDSVMAQV